jgi:predicted nucleotidyltransferase
MIVAQTPIGFQTVTKERLQETANHIADALDVDKIILFGSYAFGDPTPHSDVDLLIIKDTDLSPAERSIEVSRLLNPRPFPVDILVYTNKEIQKRLDDHDLFIQGIMKDGIVLYNAG